MQEDNTTAERNRSEWEEDLTPQQVAAELRAAKARSNLKKRMKDFSKVVDGKNRGDRWRAMYNFLRTYNPSARRAIDDFEKDCERIRLDQTQFNAAGQHLQYGLHFPTILWDALALVDPEFANFDTLDDCTKRRLYRELGRVFPQYWMPRV